MPQLALKTLECIKKQDAFKDTIRIHVNDVMVAGDFKMDKNDDPLTLNAGPFDFTTKAKIELSEIDKNSKFEVLGEHEATDDEAGDGSKFARFNDHGSDYLLEYEVSD